MLASTLLAAARYDEAGGQCEKLPADFVFASDCLGVARLFQGRTDEAIRILATANDWGHLAHAYARAGRRAEAEKLMSEGPILHPQRRGPFQYALAYAGFQDKDRTLPELERMAASAGPARMGFTLNGPEFEFLRGDARLKILRRRVGLPE